MSSLKNNNIAPAINFHLWQPCNMRCKFCFATFHDMKNTILPKGHLPEAEATKVVQRVADFGFEKITFAGGEPTLCPWLFKLMELAKKMGMTTMLVTNGTRITDDFLVKYASVLDWITLSVDSVIETTNLKTGRAVVGKKVLTEEKYLEICNKIHQHGYRLKINTVVTVENYQEDLNDFINIACPERWKIFQVLPIKGENDGCIEQLSVTTEQYASFLERHLMVHEKIMVKESNDDMTASYLMLDPAGRFYSNKNGVYCYSEPILKVGIPNALQEVDFDIGKFKDRNGLYNWK